MKKEKFEEFLQLAKIEKEKWIKFNEIDSIIVNSGKGYYANWKHCRFYISGAFIYIQHGDSYPYGARLVNSLSFSYNFMEVSFNPSNIIQPSTYYTDFREPKVGDTIVSTDGLERVLSESRVMSARKYLNMFKITLSNPVIMTDNSRLSFYDPDEYEKNLCSHGDVAEGIYMKFKPNDGKKRSFGVYHEKIKIKDIAEINLSLKCNKTYSIK